METLIKSQPIPKYLSHIDYNLEREKERKLSQEPIVKKKQVENLPILEIKKCTSK